MSYIGGSRLFASTLNSSSPQLLATASGAGASLLLPIPTMAMSYDYLKVCWRGRSSASVAAEQLYVQLNVDSGSNYLVERVETNNTTTTPTGPGGATTTRIQIATITAGSATGLYFASGEFLVSGASDTTNFKTVVGTATAFGASSNGYAGTYGGQWGSAAAVASLTLTCATGNFVAGSMASVYGLH